MDVGGRAGAAPAGSSKGHEAASHDPNFPVGGLDIQPSHDRFGVRQRHQQQGPGPGHAGASGGRVHQSGSSASASVGSEQKAPESGSDHEQGEPWACDSKADIETYGIAGRIWEAAYVMRSFLTPASSAAARYEYDPPCTLFTPSTVGHGQPSQPQCVYAVELGAGVGIVGIHVARQFNAAAAATSVPRTRIVLTDLENVVPLLRRNAERAQLAVESLEASSTTSVPSSDGQTGIYSQVSVAVRPLPWGSASHAAALINDSTRHGGSGITHVVCSDLVYFTELLAPLLRTLLHLTDPRADVTTVPQVIIGYKIRSLPKEEPFWRAFGAWFDFVPVACRPQAGAKCAQKSSDWQRLGSRMSHFWTGADGSAMTDDDDDDDDDDPLADDDVYVFVATRRASTLGCHAPADDASLIGGCMERFPAADGGLCEEVQGTGMDAFEFIRMAEATPFDM